jgi:hypothetical protein
MWRSGKNRALQARHRAQHRHLAVVLNGVSQDIFVAGAGHLIENDPGEVHLGVKVLTAQNQGSRGAGGHGAIHHQHHRHFQKLGQFRGAVGALGIQAIKKAAVALHQQGIRDLGMA